MMAQGFKDSSQMQRPGWLLLPTPAEAHFPETLRGSRGLSPERFSGGHHGQVWARQGASSARPGFIFLLQVLFYQRLRQKEQTQA